MKRQILDLRNLAPGQIIKVDELGSGIFFAIVTKINDPVTADNWVFEKRHVKNNGTLSEVYRVGGMVRLSFVEFNENARKWDMTLNTIAADQKFISPNDSDYHFSFSESSIAQVKNFLKEQITGLIPKFAKERFNSFLKSYEILIKKTK